MICLTFPDDDRAPAETAQATPIPLVPKNVRLEFLFPEDGVTLRIVGKATSWMPVPEAPVDKDNGAVTRQDDVGASRQILPVKAESETETVED